VERPTIPTINFRIFKMDSPDAWLVVGVDGQCPDCFGVMWSLRLGVASTGFAFSAGVEITDKAGNVDEVFRLSEEATSAADAADLIQRYSTEVAPNGRGPPRARRSISTSPSRSSVRTRDPGHVSGT
jgi:hypothetical protein